MLFPTPSAGVDEAGRGCLAGPLVAAAVILPEEFDLTAVKDSKLLSSRQRDQLEGQIKSQALAWSLGLSWPREIEKLNILQATIRAMCRAIQRLSLKPAFVAIDGNQSLPLPIPQQCFVQGDKHYPVISAASILAKTFRDRLMFHLDRRYSGYGFAQHKGYGTRDHIQAIQRLGPCPMHRMTFRPLRKEKKEVTLCLPGI
jgi:ribonuclease HII